jgi:hypothetical protein
MPGTPLPRLSRLSRVFSGSQNRRSQAQLAPDLVRLVRFLRTFLQRDQKRGSIYEKHSAANAPKMPKRVEFYRILQNRDRNGHLHKSQQVRT